MVRRWLLRLTPLLIAAVAGLWLWRGGAVQVRGIIFRIPADARGEVRGFGGVVLSREEEGGPWTVLKSEFTNFKLRAAPAEVVMNVPLESGEYRIVGGYQLPDGRTCAVDEVLSVDEAHLVLNVPSPGPECRATVVY